MSIQYKIYLDHVVVIGRDDNERSIVIPNTYYNRPVTKISPEAFAGDEFLQAIALPDILEEIGADAFRDCKHLKTIIPKASLSIKRKFLKDTVDFPCVLRSIGKRGFYGCESIAHISFRGATFLGESAFAHCRKLKSVIYENRTEPTAICESAFSGCVGLREVYLPWLYRIAPYTFVNCYNLQQVVFSGNIREVEDYAFAIAPIPEDTISALTTLELPKGITRLGRSAFEGQRRLRTIALPDSLCDIGEESFKNCSDLDQIDLPKQLHSIGAQSFAGCRSLRRINIPATVSSIGQRFCEDSGIVDISVDPDSTHFLAKDGVLYGNNGETVLCCSPQKKGAVDLLPSAREIAPYAFCKCMISATTFPSQLKYIGKYAFCASRIENVHIPEGVRHIHKSAFSICTALFGLTFYPGTQIDYINHFGGSDLQEVYYHGTYKEYQSDVFGEGAFYRTGNCPPSKPTVHLLSREGEWFIRYAEEREDTQFRYLNLGDHIKIIASLSNDPGLLIPDKIEGLPVRAIGGKAFFEHSSECTFLIIPSTVEEVEPDAFFGLDELQSICIPETITDIDMLLESCPNLSEIYYQGTRIFWALRVHLTKDISRTHITFLGDETPEAESSNKVPISISAV